MTRPEPDRPAPEGFRHVAEVDTHWRVATDGAAGTPGRQCRHLSHRIACGAAAVARMYRYSRRSGTWWAYCAEHMYGRWIENGQVMVWHLHEIGEEER